ncbi:MAG TPA: DUF302 domain-containing protein [Lentimicrobium sp.]|nr:DUF302 domain-containing protein [Lentimicrobium sp.]
MEKPVVMFENQSRFGFAETIENLTNAIDEGGWKILATHNLQETMRKNGREVLPVSVIELCNPALAFRILSQDAYRDSSPMLPCRVSVYEKQDGSTWISRMNVPAFAEMTDGDAGQTMKEAFEIIEKILQPLIR